MYEMLTETTKAQGIVNHNIRCELQAIQYCSFKFSECC